MTLARFLCTDFVNNCVSRSHPACIDQLRLKLPGNRHHYAGNADMAHSAVLDTVSIMFALIRHSGGAARSETVAG